MAIRKFYYYAPIFLQKVGYIFFGILYSLFLNIEIKGRENLKGLENPVIFACNHTHELDVTIMPLVFGFLSSLYPIYYVSNSTERFKTFGWRSYFYGGNFFNMLGGYSIHPGFHNYAISLEDHLEILNQKKNLFIFPEGKRTLDGNLNPGRGGLGYMVHTTNAIVIPIVIDTFFNLSVREFFLGRRKVVISVLKPLYKKDILTTDNPMVEDFQKASQIVIDKMKEVLS